MVASGDKSAFNSDLKVLSFMGKLGYRNITEKLFTGTEQLQYALNLISYGIHLLIS